GFVPFCALSAAKGMVINMNEYAKLILELLSPQLRGRKPHVNIPDSISREKLYHDSVAHQVQFLICDALLKMPSQLEADFADALNEILMTAVVRETQREHEISHVINALAAENIDVVAFKGAYLKFLYPLSQYRIMGDVDLFLTDISQIGNACALFERLGYTWSKEEGETYCFRRGDDIPIDLHTYVKFVEEGHFFDEKNQRILGEVFRLSECITEDVDGCRMKLFSHTDHFAHLFSHMACHITLGGFGFRQLCDVVVYVLTRGDRIDYSRFWHICKLTGYTTFAANILYVCRDYLALDTDEIFGALNSSPPNFSEALIDDMYENGVFGYKSREKLLINKAAGGAVRANKEKGSRFGAVSAMLHAAFPLYIKQEKYAYAMHHRILLPVAWAHRLIDFVFGRMRPSDFKTLIEQKNSVDKRLKLLADLELY
ncbi:MAG: nucleotidyltransferase family protein, partial [Clostridia bacterium]|nr:nucleotidyltransferase family protein [Clostridia bacterium]